MRTVDLIARVGEPEVLQLIRLAVGADTTVKLPAVAQSYAQTAGSFLVGLASGSELVGVAGGTRESRAAVLRHLAVVESHRGLGHGRRLLQTVISRFDLQRLVAETDTDAVEFYRTCGFAITSLGERYPASGASGALPNQAAAAERPIRWAEG